MPLEAERGFAGGEQEVKYFSRRMVPSIEETVLFLKRAIHYLFIVSAWAVEHSLRIWAESAWASGMPCSRGCIRHDLGAHDPQKKETELSGRAKSTWERVPWVPRQGTMTHVAFIMLCKNAGTVGAALRQLLLLAADASGNFKPRQTRHPSSQTSSSFLTLALPSSPVLALPPAGCIDRNT